MTEFLLADFNLYFGIAICFVVLLAFIEGLGLIIGLSLMNVLDQLTPIDIDSDIDVSSGGLTSVLGWLCINRMPLLVWLVIFLSSFGLAGYSLNYLTLISLNFVFSAFLVGITAIIFAVYFTKLVAKPLAKLLPKNESSALSNQSFVGLAGKITVGKASFENPAEAVIHDSYQQKHYVLVAPVSPQEVFVAGSDIVLIEKLEKYWLAASFDTLNK